MNFTELVAGAVRPPQSRPGFRREDMVVNNAGGYVFAIDKWAQLNRFLILGSESNTYYVSAKDLTIENMDNVIKCIDTDGIRVVNECIRVSDQGLAPKNDPAILVMALCCSVGDNATKRYAFNNLNRVCRIGTHIMMFAKYCDMLRGWGRGLREGIAGWYNTMPVDRLAYQVAKYKNREGWSHRDLLRKSHPRTRDVERNKLYNYITHQEIPQGEVFAQLRAIDEIFAEDMTIERACSLITEYNLTREMIPTNFLNDLGIWRALLEKMPLTAMIRNLGKMTSIGLLANNSPSVKYIVDSLTNEVSIQKARIHPLSLVIAYRTYLQGHGDKGSLAWTPVKKVMEALDDAFIKSFHYLVPTGKRISMNFDVSGSMWYTHCAGLQNFMAAEAVGALGLAITVTEPNCDVYKFSSTYSGLDFPRVGNIDKALHAIQAGHKFGNTDCALPMVYALKNKIPYDLFMIYTDNETWYGNIHPYQALKDYRKGMGIDAKMIVCAVTATRYSIADPADKGMMDIVGFDASVPSLVSRFMNDEI